jgi:hypothetical protein
MRIIINRIIKDFGIRQNIKPIIGRWNLDYNINSINRKIDLSNEDHCGTCTSSEKNENIKSIYIHKSFKYKLTNH